LVVSFIKPTFVVTFIDTIRHYVGHGFDAITSTNRFKDMGVPGFDSIAAVAENVKL
jgi:isopentenyl diphosphate isomerase/L-lactate dehydrogenase-like FMN-dependent dehydrogenase